MQKGIKRCRRSTAAQLGACPGSLPVLGWMVEQEGEACTTIAALIIPKDQFPDHYLPPHTRRHTHTSLMQGGFISYHLRNRYKTQRPFALGLFVAPQ